MSRPKCLPRAALPYYLRNAGAPWSASDIERLRDFADRNTPTRVIGFMLGRSARAVIAKAGEVGISLKPYNRSPYGRAA